MALFNYILVNPSEWLYFRYIKILLQILQSLKNSDLIGASFPLKFWK